MELEGKVALVTGSTSGIGLSIAQAFADAGADVVINGFGDAVAIEAERAAIEAKGVKCIYDGADMARPEQIAAMVENAVDSLGKIDILVNNAGIQHVSKVEDFPLEKWDSIIAINLSSAFHTIRSALPYMKKQQWGRIINIGSAHSLVASPFKSAYVAAKHGILGLTKVVALEVAEEGITVNTICPGYVYTPLVEGQIADTAKARGISEEEVMRDVILKAQWTKKFVTTDQIAGLALFLCSDAAENITGSAQSIDGGFTAS